LEKPDALVTAGRLTAAMTGMTEALKTAVAETEKASRERDDALTKYGHRNRLYIAIDVGLTVLLTVVTLVAIHASSRANVATVAAAAARQNVVTIHANQVAACRIGNALRHRQAQALDSILFLGKIPKNYTAAQRRAVLAFRKKAEGLVGRGWAPLNCRQIYHLGTPSPPVPRHGATPGRPTPASSP
jgi:hypothetical protein